MPTPTSSTALFGSAYLGSVRYYAAMLQAGTVAIDPGEHIGRRAWQHCHCRIVGANGVQTLAVPVEHIDAAAAGRIAMRDLRIAEHGSWRRVHWGALFSAYGKTPFFEYAEDDLRRVYERGDRWLLDFNMAMHHAVVNFLDLPISTASAADGWQHDWRGRIGGKQHDAEAAIADVPYYNIWQPRHGFIPDLSIIDLLMNCGREAILVLLEMLREKLN